MTVTDSLTDPMVEVVKCVRQRFRKKVVLIVELLLHNSLKWRDDR